MNVSERTSTADLPAVRAGSEPDFDLVDLPALCDQAMRDLAEARDMGTVLLIHDRVEAFRVYARKRDAAVHAQNRCVDIVLLAERRIGEELKAQKETVGFATGGDAQRTRFRKGTESPPKLAELGLTKKQSSDYQALASVPESVIHEAVEAATAEDRLATKVAVKRAVGGASAGIGKRALEIIVAGEEPPKIRELAAEHGIARAYLANARRVLLHAPDLVPAVLSGDMKLGSALYEIERRERDASDSGESTVPNVAAKPPRPARKNKPIAPRPEESAVAPPSAPGPESDATHHARELYYALNRVSEIAVMRTPAELLAAYPDNLRPNLPITLPRSFEFLAAFIDLWRREAEADRRQAPFLSLVANGG